MVEEREGRYRRRKTDGRREHRTVIAHSDEEWARVKSLAAAQGVSVPRLYERSLHVGDALAVAKLSRVVDEMLVIQRLMAKTSVNLNQLAMVANATGEVSGPQVLAAAEHFDRQIERVKDLLGQVAGGDRYERFTTPAPTESAGRSAGASAVRPAGVSAGGSRGSYDPVTGTALDSQGRDFLSPDAVYTHEDAVADAARFEPDED